MSIRRVAHILFPGADPECHVMHSYQQYRHLYRLVGRRLRTAYNLTTWDVEIQLAATMRFLIKGETLEVLSQTVGLPATTIGDFLPRTMDTMFQELERYSFPLPNTIHQWYGVTNDFQHIYGCPHVLGVIDVQVYEPQQSPEHSVILLSLVNFASRFMYIQIKPFRDGDHLQTIYTESSLCRDLRDNTLHIPLPRRVDGSADLLPYFFVGNERFPEAAHVKKAITSTDHLSPNEVQFNEKLIATQKATAMAYARLGMKFKVLSNDTGCVYDSWEPFARILKTCCVLHNFLLDHSPAADPLEAPYESVHFPLTFRSVDISKPVNKINLKRKLNENIE